MSVENVRKFYKKIKEDKELQTELRAIVNELREAHAQADKKVLQLASKAGISFSHEGLNAARHETISNLPNNFLENISGGGLIVETSQALSNAAHSATQSQQQSSKAMQDATSAAIQALYGLDTASTGIVTSKIFD